MYVCMYVCMHACMHVCMYVCMYVYIYIYIYICDSYRQSFAPGHDGAAPARGGGGQQRCAICINAYIAHTTCVYIYIYIYICYSFYTKHTYYCYHYYYDYCMILAIRVETMVNIHQSTSFFDFAFSESFQRGGSGTEVSTVCVAPEML